jgi:hypothetical protein
VNIENWSFQQADSVWILIATGVGYQPSEIHRRTGPLSYECKLKGRNVPKHADQLRFRRVADGKADESVNDEDQSDAEEPPTQQPFPVLPPPPLGRTVAARRGAICRRNRSAFSVECSYYSSIDSDLSRQVETAAANVISHSVIVYVACRSWVSSVIDAIIITCRVVVVSRANKKLSHSCAN